MRLQKHTKYSVEVKLLIKVIFLLSENSFADLFTTCLLLETKMH